MTCHMSGFGGLQLSHIETQSSVGCYLLGALTVMDTNSDSNSNREGNGRKPMLSDEDS